MPVITGLGYSNRVTLSTPGLRGYSAALIPGWAAWMLGLDTKNIRAGIITGLE